jgi:hypothetical protein
MPTAVEKIMWTAVPNGITSVNSVTFLQISVHVAPELSGGATGTLTDFAHFQNWPQTLLGSGQQIHLEFSDGGSTTTRTVQVAIDTTALNPNLWQALFSPAGSIEYAPRDSAEPYTTTPVVSYPSGQVASFLQSTYTNLATSSPTAYPPTQMLGGIYGTLGYGNQDGLSLLRRLWSDLSQQRLRPPVTHAGAPPYANDWAGADAATAFAALRFYHMAPQGTPVKPTLPVVDFHRALTFIGQHPALQRALGLVLDITIPISDVTSNFPAFAGSAVGSDVYVSGDLANVDGTSDIRGSVRIRPRVRCSASQSVFEAFAATGQIVGRQLTLGDPGSFSVHEIDVDGGGLKTAQFADNLKLAQTPQSGAPGTANGPAPDAPQAYAPPSLRSAGLTVAAVNRGLSFVSRLQRGSDLLSGAAASPPAVPDLTAEDLVRGFVLDVYDAPGKAWHSTGARSVVYTATPSGGATITLNAADEAGTDAPPRSQTDPTNPAQAQLNLPENLIRWNGWSNAAPRPGNPLAADGSSSVATAAGSGPFGQLQIGVSPPAGSLPRLRFGTAYALRARVVDIAGNALALSDGAPLGDGANRVSPLAVYGRHEPVGSPDIYSWSTPAKARPHPGESLKRLVIRDIDASVSSIRAFAPNRVAESFAELHGMFDTGAGGAVDGGAATYELITGHESARYTPGTAISFTNPVPYLPDPLARGGTLFVAAGTLAGSSYQFDFKPATGKSWPNYQPYGITLMPGGTQNVILDAAQRQLTFLLTKGDTVNLQLSSHVDSGDLIKLGMFQWISAFYHGAVPGSFQNDVLTGLNWSMTPYTTLELVFAVQKPLLAPLFSNFGPLKVLGLTYAELFGDLTYSPKSTARTDLLATWGEPVDNGPGTGAPHGPGAPVTTLALRQSTVFTIPSSHTQQAVAIERFTGRHEFFDTKHREVVYIGKATSRFTEHYQGVATINVPSPGTATPLALPGFPGLGLEPGSVVVSNGTTVYQDKTGFTIDAAAGTITFIKPPAGPPTGSSVTIDFLPPVSVDSGIYPLNILSSARPLSADIAFIVPIYEWSKVRKVGAKTYSGRSPSALRIFLSRPWWSSGIGELLGVVTYPGAEFPDITATIPAATSSYVSDWGEDPVFQSRFQLPSPHPRLKSFPFRVHSHTDLTIDERAGIKVNVAGHKVQYDAVRDLWYCDVRIDIARSYTPMIRLALARYQPDSVPGAELSRIVLADVMSVEPGRAAVIVRKSPTLLSSVTLAGYSYEKDAHQGGTGPGVAELVVERRVSSIHDEVVGWEPVEKPIAMSSYTDHSGRTFWTARDVKIPAGGKHRLFIAQYEVVPDDRRKQNVYIAFIPSRGLRLLYQDLIPL